MDNKTVQQGKRKFFQIPHSLKLFKRLEEQMNNYNVKKKLNILYICCMLLPLIITDSIILFIILRGEQSSERYEFQNIAEAVQYNLASEVNDAVSTANNIYMNRYINNFLTQKNESPLDYYNNYLTCMKYSLFKSSIRTSRSTVIMYADNETIINGGEFARLETIRETQWYRYMVESGQNIIFYVYYDNSKAPAVDARRKISLIRKLNYYERDGCEKVLKIDLDYSGLVQDLNEMNYEVPVYICMGDQIILSNDGSSSIWEEFDLFQDLKKVGYQEKFNIYGLELDIYVLSKERIIGQRLQSNIPIIILLICVNALLPWLFVKIINRSFTERLQELSSVFEDIEDEKLMEIPNIRGADEIGVLMCNYNRMASRLNELIQTTYKDKLTKQEMDIARQNAELLALHSQINPHFLFNTLESIRMHSVLKNEIETADMVEKLATMERQYVDWRKDSITIKKEIVFAEAYLELQKYRFGDRLSYLIKVDDRCQKCQIPKLTLVTFVENACVHGIESKAEPGWIFIHVYPEGLNLCMVIEDTGNGIKEPLLSVLQNEMKNVDIITLKENDKGRVGIANACLRLKMVTGGEVWFELDSEEGVGTIVTIRMPLKYTG